ncbi:MAG: DUF4157 domain-containing protein, partial [Myxococcota bacterium]
MHRSTQTKLHDASNDVVVRPSSPSVAPGKASSVQRRYAGIAPAQAKSEDVSSNYIQGLHFGGPIQRAASGAAYGEHLSSQLSGGSALPQTVQAKLENHFGASRGAFGNLTVHNDSTANRLCAETGARAFTTNVTQMAFASGAYNPNTPQGLGLITHEVAHTIQQSKNQTSQLAGLGG